MDTTKFQFYTRGRFSRKKLEAHLDSLFQKYGYGVEFNVMDLGKIFTQGRLAYFNGQNLEEATKDAIAKYRKN